MVDIFAKILRDDKKRKPGYCEIDIEKIYVMSGRRATGKAKVEALAASIEQLGLLHPVGVTKGLRLIYGAHRLEAAKSLKWNKIPAIIHELDALHAELAELDENLMRSGLSSLDESKALARRKELYEAIHPQTKHGGDRKSKQKSSGQNVHSNFAEDTAAKTGLSARQVRRDVAIGKAISDEAAKLIQDTPIANNKSELAKLAKLPEDRQIEVAQAIADGDVGSVSEVVDNEKPSPSGDFELTTWTASDAAPETPEAPVATAMPTRDVVTQIDNNACAYIRVALTDGEWITEEKLLRNLTAPEKCVRAYVNESPMSVHQEQRHKLCDSTNDLMGIIAMGRRIIEATLHAMAWADTYGIEVNEDGGVVKYRIPRRTRKTKSLPPQVPSDKAIAETVGTTVDDMAKASRIIAHSPELTARVESGELTLDEALGLVEGQADA